MQLKRSLKSIPGQSESPYRRVITVYDWGLFIHLLVALEHRRSDKGLLAEVALILLMAIVNHLDVDVERVLPLERGVALVALECPLTCGKDRETLVRAISSHLLLGLWTHSHHAQQEQNQFRRGDCAGGKIQRGVFHCTRQPRTMVFRKVWVCFSFIVYL